jgi:hypothetical protein
LQSRVDDAAGDDDQPLVAGIAGLVDDRHRRITALASHRVERDAGPRQAVIPGSKRRLGAGQTEEQDPHYDPRGCVLSSGSNHLVSARMVTDHRAWPRPWDPESVHFTERRPSA